MRIPRTWLGVLERAMKMANSWVALAVAGVLAGCGGQRQEQVLVTVDGASAVYPVPEVVAAELRSDTAGSIQATGVERKRVGRGTSGLVGVAMVGRRSLKTEK